eukprot:4817974-Pyramimonas_sp.AAC.1
MKGGLADEPATTGDMASARRRLTGAWSAGGILARHSWRFAWRAQCERRWQQGAGPSRQSSSPIGEGESDVVRSYSKGPFAVTQVEFADDLIKLRQSV